MKKKYELTEETIEFNGHVLHRIKALMDFGNVNKGDLGGWIEKEDNLPHEGDCWVYENAKVFGNTNVHKNAHVYSSGTLYGKATVYPDAVLW